MSDDVKLLSVLPGPNNSRFSESQWELGSTFDLADPLPVQPLYILGDVAAFAASTTELPEVPITPGKHQTWKNKHIIIEKLNT